MNDQSAGGMMISFGKNPQTTISGLIGLIGTIMTVIGTTFQPKPWAQIVLALGLALNGGNGVGNILSKDGHSAHGQ